MEMFIFILGWFLVGASSYVVVETRLFKNDIKKSDIPLMLILSSLGIFTLTIGLTMYAYVCIEDKIKKNDGILFRAKE